MSDAFTAPGSWAYGAGREGRRGPGHHQHRQGRRAAREAFLAAMTTDDATADAGEPRGRSRRGEGRGRGRFGGPGFGGPGGPPFGPGGGRGRGRARRGDVRAAILTLLAEEGQNGYGLIQQIEERSGGVWKPSPGAIYPSLQQLEDEGLVRPVEHDGRKVFELTDAGRAHVEALGTDAPAPWDAVVAQAGTGARDAKHQIAQLWHAYSAVRQDGTPAQVQAAQKILSDARRSLYRILAEDDDGADGAIETGTHDG